MLREFCYDKETGDDGERLMNCKKWADEKREETEKVIKRVLLGVSLGGIAGVMIGEMQGAVAAFAIVGMEQVLLQCLRRITERGDSCGKAL